MPDNWAIKCLRAIAIAVGIALTALAIYAVMFYADLRVFCKDYTAADLVKNFNKKSGEINALKTYYNTIAPQNTNVLIEFADDHTVARLKFFPVDTFNQVNLHLKFGGLHLAIGTKRMDSLLALLGWTNSTLHTLKQKLDAAGCISIQNGDPAEVGFKRSGLIKYSYLCFDTPIPDSLRSHYNDSCRYVYINKKLVLDFDNDDGHGLCLLSPYIK